MRCLAKESGVVSHKGRACLELHVDGKPVYSCYGYIDPENECLLDECARCPRETYNFEEAYTEIRKYRALSYNDYQEILRKGMQK